MTEAGKIFNLKINVNGKVHNVKVEEGVTLQGNFVTSKGMMKEAIFGTHDHGYGNDFEAYDKKFETYKKEHPSALDYNNVYSYKQVDEIKMTEAQFSVFKNVADNVKEQGDEIVFSKADLKKARELYSQGNFTEDISKNLPSGYHADKGMQYKGDK